MFVVDKSEKFSWLVRVGYFSRAVLYTVVGLIEDFPAGIAILWIMVFGLFGYALFRFCSPLFDIENEGSDAKGWGKRIGHAGSAIGHLALSWSAFKFATDRNSGGGGAQEAAAGVLGIEFGGVLIGLLGLTFFIAAFNQAKKGITGSFMNRISPQAPDFTRWIGGAGAVVFVVIGWSLVGAGFMSKGSDQVKTIGDAVASLADNGIWFTITAIGLLLFGLFSFILARYRIIPDLGSEGKVPEFRAG